MTQDELRIQFCYEIISYVDRRDAAKNKAGTQDKSLTSTESEPSQPIELDDCSQRPLDIESDSPNQSETC